MILNFGDKFISLFNFFTPFVPLLYFLFLLSNFFLLFFLSGEAGTGQPSPCNQWVADVDALDDNDNQGSLQTKKMVKVGNLDQPVPVSWDTKLRRRKNIYSFAL